VHFLLRSWVFNMRVESRLLRLADGSDLLEKSACGFVQPHRRFPLQHSVYRRRKMSKGVIDAQR